MATSIFDKKEYQPTDDDLKEVLATSLGTWDYLFDYLEHHYGKLVKEWKFYSKKAGWALRVSNEKGKNIIFLSPNANHFLVNINLSVKIKEQVLQANISDENKKILESAKVYVEGVSLLTAIKDRKDLEDVQIILGIRDDL